MRVVKKIFTLILAFVCIVCTLLSCSNEGNVGTQMDSSKMYANAKSKTDSLESYEIKKNVDRVFTGESGSFSDTALTTFKHVLNEDGSHRYSKEYSSVLKTELGEDIKKDSSLLCIDNMMYEKTIAGEKFSYIAKDSDISEEFGSVIPTFPAEALANSSVYSGDITQVVSEAEAATLYSQLYLYLNGITEYYSPNDRSDVFEFTYSNVKINYNIDVRGCFDKIEMSFDAYFDHKKGTSEIKTLVTFEFSDPDDKITVDVPENASEYVWYVEAEGSEQSSLENEIEALYDELGNPVADYDILYTALCEKYGKENVDALLAKTQPDMDI